MTGFYSYFFLQDRKMRPDFTKINRAGLILLPVFRSFLFDGFPDDRTSNTAYTLYICLKYTIISYDWYEVL